MSAVIYGKHPAFGDFLAHGLPHKHLHVLDEWLETVLPDVRKGLGDNWEAAWEAAPPLRFWIGPMLLGVPLIGIFLPSMDKVGRRFPLFFALSDVVTPPPVHAAFDPAPYDALWNHVSQFEMPQSGPQGAERLLAGFEMPDLQGAPWDEGQDGTIWGQRADGDLDRLFRDARPSDNEQAQLMRSHWWQTGRKDREAGWLGCNGLPDAGSLTWLLTARVRQAQNEDAPAMEDTRS